MKPIQQGTGVMQSSPQSRADMKGCNFEKVITQSEVVTDIDELWAIIDNLEHIGDDER